MSGICEGRVAVITGAGRGIGRAHALEFARQGAKVVVNDLGAELDGTGGSTGPAGEVVDLIRQAGGEAIANGDDVASWDGAKNMVDAAIEAFGRLDTLVCNAGALRDRMLVNQAEDEFDLVVRVHMKGHFAPLRHAAAYWRGQAKAGTPVAGRAVLTSSAAGLYGSVGQFTYSAAKAGIAAMARVAGSELKSYGVMVNAIAPIARTRMTEQTFADDMAPVAPGEFDAMDPSSVSPLVVWLGSDDCDITGQTLEMAGGKVTVAESWSRGPERDKGDRWEPEEIGPVVRELVAASKQMYVIGAR